MYLLLACLFLQAPQEPKLATLEGAVMHAASKTPIRKAKVTLTPTGSDTAAATVETGDDGKFALKDVKAGRYRLAAERTGYQETAYGARKPGQALGQVLRVDAGASLTGLSIMMPKHGVIAGKIVDADNEPVAKTLVMALQGTYVNGKRIWLPRGTLPVLANDLGEYRIGELPPGKYTVCAVPIGFVQPSQQAGDMKPAAEDASSTTCFPAVAQIRDGTGVDILDGAEVPGIDIRLIKTKTVSVQGKISGMPQSAGAVTILNLATKGFGPIGNAMHPRAIVMGGEGKFEFKSVQPGSYILHTLATGLGNVPFVVKANVEIGDQPVTDLTVPALVPFELKGKVTAEPSPDLKPGSIRVILTGADDITLALAMATPNNDGDMTIANVVPGRHRITVTGFGPAYYVSGIRLGEQAVEGDEVEISSAAAPLSVSLAIGHGEINGSVRNDKGEPVPGAHIGLVPDPRRPFRLKMTRTDQAGAFRIPSVAPGDYLLLAFDTVESGALEDEEFLKPFVSKAKKVTVKEPGAQTFDLTVIPTAAK